MKLPAIVGAAALWAMMSAGSAQAATMAFTVNTGEIWLLDYRPVGAVIINLHFFSETDLLAPVSLTATFYGAANQAFWIEDCVGPTTTFLSSCSYIGDTGGAIPGDEPAYYAFLHSISGGPIRIEVTDFMAGIGTARLVHPIPLPAALPLFLSALAGLGWVGWRRRQQRVPA